MKAKYEVLLHPGLPEAHIEIFRRLCFPVGAIEGADLLVFRCTQIDISHHMYIEMECTVPNREGTHSVKIPHGMVQMIWGFEDDPLSRVGFHPREDSVREPAQTDG